MKKSTVIIRDAVDKTCRARRAKSIAVKHGPGAFMTTLCQRWARLDFSASGTYTQKRGMCECASIPDQCVDLSKSIKETICCALFFIMICKHLLHGTTFTKINERARARRNGYVSIHNLYTFRYQNPAAVRLGPVKKLTTRLKTVLTNYSEHVNRK